MKLLKRLASLGAVLCLAGMALFVATPAQATSWPCGATPLAGATLNESGTDGAQPACAAGDPAPKPWVCAPPPRIIVTVYCP